MPNIIIEYNGEYPNLCSGALAATIGGVRFTFPSYCLRSGGAVWFGEGGDEHVDAGPWSITKYPEDMPQEYHQAVLDAVNDTVRWGCCGGCI